MANEKKTTMQWISHYIEPWHTQNTKTKQTSDIGGATCMVRYSVRD